MPRQLHPFRLALIAALLAMLAAALVPSVMQMLNPVAVILTGADSQDEMPGCTDPAMRHHQADGSGQAQSCPLCSVFCHAPTLPGLPHVALLAPLNTWLLLLPLVPASLYTTRFTTPEARGPPAHPA